MAINLNANASLGLGDNTLASQAYPDFMSSLGDLSSSLGQDSTSTNSSNNSSLSSLSMEIQLLMEILQMLEQQVQQMEQGQQGQGGDGSGSGGGCGGGQGASGGGQGTSGSGGGQGSGISTPIAPSHGSDNGRKDSWFDLASGASTGDPHLSFSGSTGSGDPSSKWDDMGSQRDLLDANKSFFGGYQVSTKATAVNSNGVAYNKSATVATGNGRDTVTMGKDGKVTVDEDGKKVHLHKGQTLTLSSGAKVTENSDGSVTVADNNHKGGSISTTMSWNGQGVDVNFNASNTYLGGDLPTGGQYDKTA